MGGCEAMNPKSAIGIGCASTARPEDILSLIHSSIAEIRPDSVLATMDRRVDVARMVAAELRIPLELFFAETLARVAGTVTSSARALASVGVASVAEAAALAAVGPGGQLVLPRQTGRHCTCAFAELS
jgi:cobalt-precorrin 5A hydrolase